MDIRIDLPTLSRLYGDTRNPDILFNAILIPSQIDRETFTNELYRHTNGLEVLYTDGQLIYQLLRSYSKSRLPSWERIYKAMTEDYEITENYNRLEDSKTTATNKQSGNSNSNGSTTETANSTDKGKTLVDGNDKAENKTISYDSGSLVKNGETVTTVADRKTEDNRQTETHGKNSNDNEYTNDSKGTTTTVSRIHGNIGVTTNQAMIQEELSLRAVGVIDIICNEIVNNFCIKVW